MDTLCLGIKRIIKRAPEELGQTDPEDLPCEIPEEGSVAAFHGVNEVDALICPKCSGKMNVISVIEDEEVIKKILQRRTSPQAPWIMGGFPAIALVFSTRF